MKVQVDWLKEYVEFDKTAAELGHMLTMAGLEIESHELLDEQKGDVLELNVTPNRGYCLSHLGVAREVSVLLSASFKPPTAMAWLEKKWGAVPIAERILVENQEENLCPRYAAMVIENHIVDVEVPGPGLYEITGDLNERLKALQIESGLMTLFIQHTSASLLIQENASSDVLADLNNFFKQLVPESGNYLHSIEGADDMPAHIKNALTLSSLLIPVKNKSLDLGTWQGIFLFEHRHSKFKRQVNVSVFN